MTYHDIINVIIFNRVKIITITILASVLIFLILLFIYPIKYNSTVTILPPETNSKVSGIGSLLGGQDFSNILSGGFTNANSQLYMEILKSRSAALHVVRKHNLTEYYDLKSEYEAAAKLSGKINLELTKEGIIKLNVDVATSIFPMINNQKDSARIFAAALSNSYVEALDIINREKLSSKAKRAREYIEDQLLKTKSLLDSAETALMEFQQGNRTIALPEQIRAAIDAAANLKTEIIKTEIEIGLMQENLREDNRSLQALRSRLSELQQQYAKLELGNQDYLLSFSEVPELGKDLASILREVKIQNEVYLLLQQQYYKEKIQENRDLPTVEVLDEAIPPLRASSPRTLFSTVLGGIFVFMLMSLVFVISEKRTFEFKSQKKVVN
jgi:tyrosine-protein kinase Etk/Wzc